MFPFKNPPCQSPTFLVRKIVRSERHAPPDRAPHPRPVRAAIISSSRPLFLLYYTPQLPRSPSPYPPEDPPRQPGCPLLTSLPSHAPPPLTCCGRGRGHGRNAVLPSLPKSRISVQAGRGPRGGGPPSLLGVAASLRAPRAHLALVFSSSVFLRDSPPIRLRVRVVAAVPRPPCAPSEKLGGPGRCWGRCLRVHVSPMGAFTDTRPLLPGQLRTARPDRPGRRPRSAGHQRHRPKAGLVFLSQRARAGRSGSACQHPLPRVCRLPCHGTRRRGEP